MKKSILHVLELKLFNGGGPAMRGHTDQMMPAENLVQNDPVGKTAETHAQHETGPNQWIIQSMFHSAGV